MKKLAAFIIFVVLTGYVFGEQGVSDSEILLGQSCALKGPAQALGTGMKEGLTAYFEKVNAAGGIKGRQIRLSPRRKGVIGEAVVPSR